MKQDYTTLISAIVAALAGSKLWDWLQKRGELALAKEKQNDDKLAEYRDDLRERVAKLEGLIDSQQSERIALLQQIGQLNAELAAMKVKLEFLEAENSQLRNRLRSEGIPDVEPKP
jgi:predicted nuclease with TOPRIM domain